MRTLLPLLLLPLALAGCGTPQQDTLRAIYADALDLSGAVPMVHGAHLEARAGGGAWGPSLDVAAQAPLLQGPRMDGPAPQGGGGDAHALPPVGVAIEVRLREALRLGGLTAHWLLLDEGAAPDLAAAQAKLPGDGTFQATLTRPGPFQVVAILTRSAVDGTPQAVFEPLRGRLAATWMATGEVQPMAAPLPPRADHYAAEVRPGARLVATTSFEGPYTGREGTDVDVGLYAPDGRPAACGSGPSPLPGIPAPPGPGQAAASATAQATVGGAWGVRVGAQEPGCGGAAAAHANAGPVPYRLVVTAG